MKKSLEEANLECEREFIKKETRRSRLIERRNRCLIARYYYWSEIRRLRFDDVLDILQEEEFFIKDRNIMNIINTSNSYLDGLLKNATSPKQLKKEYPTFNWSIN
ncbi:hypothetical protein GQR60_07375 [Labilibaculum sp. A4]|uniref:hypothetical protein n=1 Tax=Labilibaculum TaxID=2060722 RepID=UPI000F619ABD|nr:MULTISPECIES: hypothetical protein [Labilibaculum]MDQ1770983.1 hypothetical protein [Labilibaculum euxinus]MWN76153.1 hypothetical protein [Labilibaculum euxinus]